MPLAVHVTTGQCDESTQFETLLRAVRVPQPAGPPRKRPGAVVGDLACAVQYASDWLKHWPIEDVIPVRSDQEQRLDFGRDEYRKRKVVERRVGRLKAFRRVATQYEKLAADYLVTLKLAMARRYSRLP